jgi:hypothetical protein
MRARWFNVGWFGAIFSGLVLLASCGDDDGDKKPDTDAGEGGEPGTSGSGGGGQGGRGGATAGNGGGGMPLVPVACGSELCMGVPIQTAGIQACCADEATSQCGLDTSLLATFGATPTRACEPVNQPGELDESCPASPAIQAGGFQLMPFPGCCREETGTCGYRVDKLLGAINLGLGCIDSASFGPAGGAGGAGAGGEPLPCGSSVGGTGAGGSSGAAGSSGAGGSATVEAGSGGTTG